jgi:hypothetical protein
MARLPVALDGAAPDDRLYLGSVTVP